MKIGPVTARFGGNVVLDTARAPEAIPLTGEGKGGPAGFAKGGAVVTLAEVADGTLPSYVAAVEIGGKLSAAFFTALACGLTPPQCPPTSRHMAPRAVLGRFLVKTSVICA